MGILSVTPVEPGEWRAYREIRLAALADAPHAFGSTLAREQTFTEADWRARLARGRYFLGHVDGVAMATAGGIRSAGRPDEVELIGVWAHTAARGSGLAAEVVGAVLDWAPCRVLAWVAEGNPAAERLYARLGFLPTGMRKPLPSDPGRDEFAMVREPG